MLGLGNSLSLGGAPNEFNILDTSPELWWKFNTGQSSADQDADGDADVLWTDQAGNYNGVGGFTSSIVDAKQGSFSSGAWLSADDADFLRVGDESLRLTDDYTIFIVFTNHKLEDTILGGDTTDFIRFGFTNDASKIRFKHSGATTDFTFDIDPEVGKHLYTIIRNASDEMIITQNSTTALLPARACNSGNFAVKRGPLGSQGIGDGSLYELVIYNRAVTAAELALIEADILTRNSLTAD